MRAPDAVVRAWMRFRGVPMETLTKAWWWRRCAGVPRQRTVAEIRRHRDLMGGGGDCFDVDAAPLEYGGGKRAAAWVIPA